MPPARREGPQPGEQLPVLGSGDRRRHPVAVARVLHAQQVQEVPGQDQLDGPVVAVEVPQQPGELAGGLEDVAARRPADMGVGQEHQQRVVREVVADDAVATRPVPDPDADHTVREARLGRGSGG
jgi:hypothetical protein